MSFHTTMYGAFSGRLSAFADRDGYVPETGDAADDWAGDAPYDWDEFVADAVAATTDAAASLDHWRRTT